MLGHRHRSHSGPAPAVRDAEGLVQVQVAHVAAERPGPREPHQRVQVGAVHVDLPARLVHGVADLAHPRFEHPVRGRVGDHQRTQGVAVLGDLGVQVVEVDVAGRRGGHDHDPHPGHHGRGRVRAVGARRDQADVPMRLAPAAVVGRDREQPGELALAAGVGLQGHRRVAGELGEPALQVGDQLQRARGVGLGGERVQVGELGPGDRLHLDGRVELHRARAQRDHRAVQRHVGVGETAQPAHERGLRAVLVEDRVREVLRAAREAFRQRVRGAGVQGGESSAWASAPIPNAAQTASRWATVVTSEQAMPSVSASTRRSAIPAAWAASATSSGPAGYPGLHGVEELVVHHLDAAGPQPGREHRGHPVGALRDAAQPVRSVVDGVAGGHDGQQHLGRADVAGGLLPADVLLAGLQGEPQRRVAVGVAGQADEPAGELAGVLLLHRQVAGVRTAEAQRHPEALGRAHRGVGAQLAGRGEERERQQVGRHRDQRAALVRGLDERRRVRDGAGRARVGQQEPEEVALGQPAGQVGHHQLDAQRHGPGAQHLDGLRQRVGVHHEPRGRRLARAPEQRHRLGGRGGLVEQGGPGHGEPGEVGDGGLERQQGLQAALADLRLVRACRPCTRPGSPGRAGGSPAG